MLRGVLIALGFMLSILQHYLSPLSEHVQLVIFLAGVLLLGIPHGAADLMVAEQNSERQHKPFSRAQFSIAYIGRLVLFALMLWQLPVLGLLFFLGFSAYHFGETDLADLDKNSWLGRALIVCYGLLILTVIMVNNVSELTGAFTQQGHSITGTPLFGWISTNRVLLVAISVVLFAVCGSIYFVQVSHTDQSRNIFLAQSVILVVVLLNLPLILGFTFYFIVWHSVLSITNIIGYLQEDGKYGLPIILRQIITYSIIAITAIAIAGLGGYFLLHGKIILVYVIGGLAVLTAPHMVVMHDMYNRIWSSKVNVPVAS